MSGADAPSKKGIALRTLGTLLLLGSLILTVPIALWITVAVVAAILSVGGDPLPRDYWWADYLGWAVMLAVTLTTFWGVYRLWEPTFKEDFE